MFGPSKDKTTHEQRLLPTVTGQRHSEGGVCDGGGIEERGIWRRKVEVGVEKRSNKKR